MDINFEILEKCSLFEGLSRADVSSILGCLQARTVSFKKDNNVFEGMSSYKIGVVLSGSLQNIVIDYRGNQNIIATFYAGDLFGEALVCANIKNAAVTILACEDSEVLFLDYGRIMSVCKNTCGYHLKLIQNLLSSLAKRMLFLNRKLQHVTKRTTQEKLMSYLTEQSKLNNSRYFTIPYNRQELADYLSVERSALCTELGKLRDEGVISYFKNEFKLL